MVNFLGGGAVPGVLVSGFNAENYTVPLNLTAGAATHSRFFQLAQSEGLLDVLTGQAVTMNAHHSGVEPAAFKANADLSDNFYMWSTNEVRLPAVSRPSRGAPLSRRLCPPCAGP